MIAVSIYSTTVLEIRFSRDIESGSGDENEMLVATVAEKLENKGFHGPPFIQKTEGLVFVVSRT